MKKRTHTIAIITSDLHYFNANICAGIYTEGIKNNFNIEIFLTFEQKEREKEIVHKILERTDISGLVIFTCFNHPDFYANLINEIKIPCVFVDRLIPLLTQCNFVTVDNYGGANKIGKLLIEKGARNIACLSMLNNFKINTTEDRVNGFRDSHIHHKHVNCYSEELDYANVMESMKNILNKWENTQQYPDAIFAANHLIMTAFITSVQQNKKWQNIFENTLLSCFDNLPYFDWITKPIISAEQPVQEIVYYTTNILLNNINNKNVTKPANVILPVKIIDRTISKNTI